MKKLLLVMLCALTLLFGFEQASEAQTKKVKSLSEQTQKESKIVTLKTPNIVALDTNELETFSYDAGKIKFIASSKETNGA
ncbi:MAG: hypothetical protein M3Q33_09735, partial [Acidobacteriota bacterium]|nr:hypothetical protein [Acidobacteriota bacterium]